MVDEKILVCGAGQGGHAFSGYLSLCGYDVSLYTHTPKKANIISKNDNTIKMSGIYSENAKLEKVTNNLEDAVKDTDIILIITDAQAHKYYAEKMFSYLDNQNIILMSPGVGGALEFKKIIDQNNPFNDVYVSETDTLLYSCKTPQIGHSHVKYVKHNILYTTYPEKNDTLEMFLEKEFPQFSRVDNPLMGLDDSPVFHIVGMVLNVDRILNREDFNFYIDGITDEIGNYMEEMDNERINVAKSIGLNPRSLKEWLVDAYGVQESSLYEMIQNTPPYQNTEEVPNRSPAPKTIYHRYILEEIPLRAVPTVEIANIFGLDVPCYKEMINMSSEITGINFWKTGRTIKDMGLTDKDIESWAEYYGKKT